MDKSSLCRAAVLTVALAALSVSCVTSRPEPHDPAAGANAAPAASASGPGVPTRAGTGSGKGVGSGVGASSGTGSGSGSVETAPARTDRGRTADGEAAPGPELVRDAFAGLQATLGDSCAAPGDCAYFLGRVYDELHRLDTAMKADAKGPGHFPEPIAWIKKLDARLGGDHGFENLKKNEKLLIGTRDRINTWMQGHPDDYR